MALQSMKNARAGPGLPAGPRAGGSPAKDSSRGELSSPTKSTASRDAGRSASGTDSSPTHGSAISRATAEELHRLREDCRVLAQQRDDVSFRCSHLEGEVQRCRELIQKLQASASKDDVGQGADQASKLVSAAQLSKILEGSVAALHSLCDRMQAAAPMQAAPDQVKQALGRLASELATMDTTVGMLKAELGSAAQDLLKPRERKPYSASSTPATSSLSAGLAAQASSQSVMAQAPSLATQETGACTTLSSEGTTPAWLSWESSTTGPSTRDGIRTEQSPPPQQQAGKVATEPSLSSGVDAATAAAAARPDVNGSDRGALEQHPSASSVGSRPSGLPLSAGQSGTTSGETKSSMAVPVAPPGVTHAQAVVLATAAAKHKARADKWKQRSKDLGLQLSLLNASAAAREAATSERHVASAQQLEDELRSWRAEAARLSAELSGTEAARRELEAAHQGSGNNEVRALMARAAEAVARAATLQQQLDAERAKAAAELASHQEEVAALKAAVAQEKGERARLLVSLRESHNSTLSQGGDSSEGRFRTESLQAHATAAAARTAAERAEERADAWRAEAESLRQRLQQAERGRMNLIVSLEGRLAAAERRATECSAQAAERVEELSAQLAAAEAEVRAAPQQVEAKLQELELLLAGVQSHNDVARLSGMTDVQVGRWDALTRIVRYQEAIKQLQADLKARQAAWEGERADLQATAAAAVRRSEAVARDLAELRRQTLDLQAAVDADRSQLAARHAAHVQDLQRQLDQERRLLSEQAVVKAQAAAAASGRAAEEAAAARLYELEAARSELLRELELVQGQFSQYQAQKAAEVAVLEQRIRAFIESGASTGGHASRDSSTGGDSATGSESGAFTRRNGGAVHHRTLRRPAGVSFAARRRGRGKGPGSAGSSAGGAAATSTDAAAAAAQTSTALFGVPIGFAAAGAQQIAPSQLVALARASEALVAAQREAAFERSLRGRSEAQAGLLRGAMARLRAKLKAASEQLAEVRARAIPTDEHRQLQADLAFCREQLKVARAENARRQKALQALQSMAAQPASTVQSVDGPVGGSSSTAAAAMRAARTNRFVTAPAAGPTAHPLRGSFSSAGAATGLGGIPTPAGFPFEHSLEDHLGVRLAAPGGGGVFGAGGEDDPLQAALEAATANARASAAALEAEREARQGAEAKLRDAKAAVERKATLVKDLKRRVEELEGMVQKQALAASEEASAEARTRTLAAALARKDAVIKELRERLDAVQAQLTAGSAAAEAGGEELETLRRASARLRSDLTKREAALRAALSDLDKERGHLSGATKQLELMTRREAAARRQVAAAAGTLRRRAGELLDALRGMSRVLLQAIAAMDGAADRLQHQHQTGMAGTAPTGRTAAAARKGAPAATSAAAAAGMSALDISQLTSLSVEDVRHLLGPDSGDLACMLGLQDQQYAAAAGRVAAAAASLEAARRVGELLSALEAALEAAAGAAGGQAAALVADDQDTSKDVDEGPNEEDQLRDQLLAAVTEAADPAAAVVAILSNRGRTGVNNGTAGIDAPGGKLRGRRTNVPGRGGLGAAGAVAAGAADPWDSRTLQMLVEEVQVEAQRAESELAAALRGAGAL